MGIEVPAKVWVTLGLGDVNAMEHSMNNLETFQTSFNNLIFLAVILFLDFALLIILKSEIKSLHLTYSKILLIELGIFILGVINPYIRTGLFFFSTNTLQIAVAYRWLICGRVFPEKIRFLVIKICLPFFLLGSYIILLRLGWFLLWNIGT